MSQLSQVIPADTVKKQFLPVLIALAQDPVPNIRMNVAKSIQSIHQYARGIPDLDVSIL
jgi:hypothetical protein